MCAASASPDQKSNVDFKVIQRTNTNKTTQASVVAGIPEAE
ncbi:CCDC148 isoform 6 [Pan troglodytes]|uniref:Coiled-coil domain containing 148 n=2 Tax=Homininae TaxID=207598 RepID=F8WCW7_HUMAN|nr:CCDC148 isoform 6 [Pan troglodytes]